MELIAIIWIVGALAAVVVGRHRAGVPQWGTLPLRLVLRSLPWFGSQMVAILLWPVPLVLWLVRGRPASPWELVSDQQGTLRVQRVGLRTY